MAVGLESHAAGGGIGGCGLGDGYRYMNCWSPRFLAASLATGAPARCCTRRVPQSAVSCPYPAWPYDTRSSHCPFIAYGATSADSVSTLFLGPHLLHCSP